MTAWTEIDEHGRVVFYVAFCPRCGDRAVPYMNSHLRDDGGWTCDEEMA